MPIPKVRLHNYQSLKFFYKHVLLCKALRRTWLVSFVLIGSLEAPSAFSDTASSSVSNTAGPTANSVTTGGSNLTYQSNNTYNNEFGFAPGVFCRTPSVFASGNLTRGDTDTYSSDMTTPRSYNDNWNYGGQIGLVVPFGSSILEYCKTVAKQTATDKEISTQLSLIRACASLAREGIIVDPSKYPLLKGCVIKEGELPLLAPVPQTIRSASVVTPSRPISASEPKPKPTQLTPSQPVISPKIPKLSDG